MAQHTMQGTPLYLSPKIREAYIQYFNGPNMKVAHNIYKSDVYSLGVTLIHTMTLQPPNELAFTNGLEGRIETVLRRTSHYSMEVKRMVAEMMRVEETLRPDFVQLERQFCPQRPASPVRSPPAAVPKPPSPRAQEEVYSVPELIDNLCIYCDQRKEVFQLCHLVCFDCLAETVNIQARERQVQIKCRCGLAFSPAVISLVLDPSLLPS